MEMTKVRSGAGWRIQGQPLRRKSKSQALRFIRLTSPITYGLSATGLTQGTHYSALTEHSELQSFSLRPKHRTSIPLLARFPDSICEPQLSHILVDSLRPLNTHGCTCLAVYQTPRQSVYSGLYFTRPDDDPSIFNGSKRRLLVKTVCTLIQCVKTRSVTVSLKACPIYLYWLEAILFLACNVFVHM